MTKRLIGVALACTCALPVLGQAMPVWWSGNGHKYEAVAAENGITWADAKAAAEAKGGYLATVTSAEENTFIFDTFGLFGKAYWLGGFQPTGSEEPAGGWQWVTGEGFDYTSWAIGEPNNSGGENALATAFFQDYKWNDAPEAFLYRGIGGYVIEYVPEPATLALLGLGLAGLGLSRRRKA